MTSTERLEQTTGPSDSALRVETNGINVIAEEERRGRPRDLFWPWFGANVSIFGLSYGAFALGFGISFWQAVLVGVVGIVFSFLLCGLIAVAGKRGSAPTMVLSRAAFGVRGNKLPALISWLLTVGWETVLVVLATLATATVFDRLGWGGGDATKVVALLVVAALIVAGGVIGFELIMRLQRFITVVTAVLTVVYFALVADEIHWSAVTDLPGGSTQDAVGALVFLMTGFGLGWVNLAADYSRYLPRRASGSGIVWWTTFGGFLAPLVLFVLGLAGGAVLDIYSSGLALLSIGLRVPRYVAALIDGTIMVIGSIYVVFVADDFLGQFIGFLVTLGVPVAAWCGVMLADIALRRGPYDELDLYRPAGRYGDVRLLPVAVVVGCTIVGWGLVTNAAASWLEWQGYLLDAVGLGGKDGAWAGANLGVLVALVASFLITLAFTRASVRRQEAEPPAAVSEAPA